METLPRPCRGNVSYFVFRTFVDQFSTYVTRPSEFETVGVYVSPMGGGAFFPSSPVRIPKKISLRSRDEKFDVVGYIPRITTRRVWPCLGHARTRDDVRLLNVGRGRRRRRLTGPRPPAGTDRGKTTIIYIYNVIIGNAACKIVYENSKKLFFLYIQYVQYLPYTLWTR